MAVGLPPSLLELLQLFSGFEADGLARGDGDFSAGAGVAADAGFAGPDVKDSKSPEFDAFAVGESLFHGLKDGFDGHFGLRFGDASPVYHFVNNVQLDHRNRPPGRLFNETT